MDELTKGIQDKVQCGTLFTDDIVLIDETIIELISLRVEDID